MADKVYLFSTHMQVTIPSAYGLVRVKSGLAHIIRQQDLKTICTGKVLAGPYYIVAPGPALVDNKCQKCIIKLPSHWVHLLPGAQPEMGHKYDR